MCTRYNATRKTILFSNNVNLTEEQLTNGAFGDLAEDIFSFARSMQQLDMDTTEYSLLCAMCLLSGGKCNVAM